MNHRMVLKELEHQMTVALGALVLVEPTEDTDVMLTSAKATLTGAIQGVRILVDTMPSDAMTIDELEERQFKRAKDLDFSKLDRLVDERSKHDEAFN